MKTQTPNSGYRQSAGLKSNALRFIAAYLEKNTYAPSLVEIAAGIGTPSRGHAKFILDLLERDGLVELPKLPGGKRLARVIILTAAGRAALKATTP